ncbi:sigma-E factor negative regulatory protein [Stenotrophomonas rhizophila]
MPTPGSTGAAPDKLDAHNRQQLSALIDGELSADEARFMLRRLEHDDALAGCHERWQLLGDVLRGQACAPAPLDFAGRVRLAVAEEPLPQRVSPDAERRSEVRRSGWRRWGGGAALAASVAAVAMFMTREQLPAPTPLQPAATTVIASQAERPTPAPASPPAPVQSAVAVAAVPAAAVAAAGRRQDVAAVRRASATRTQQAARSAAERSAEPQRALASQAPLAPGLPVATATARQLPFGDVASLQAKPWPRSTLAPAAGGALNASFSTQEPQAAFYPFEPRLQEVDPAAPAPRRHRD